MSEPDVLRVEGLHVWFELEGGGELHAVQGVDLTLRAGERLGLVGEYIGRIYDETKRRPMYIIDRKVNFSATAVSHPAGSESVRQAAAFRERIAGNDE